MKKLISKIKKKNKR